MPETNRDQFEYQQGRWPVVRERSEDLLQDEMEALQKVDNFRSTVLNLYSSSTKWKVSRSWEGTELSSTYCEKLNLNIFKVKCVLNHNWKVALKALLNYPETVAWNDTCETCAQVMVLPVDGLDQKEDTSAELSAWVAYIRMSDSVSRMISKRDFCTCFIMEKGRAGAVYVGTACEVSACPPLSKCVRGEQTILSVRVEQIDENTCSVTQLTSINFKGLLFQSLVDLSMVKALSSYAECLQGHVNSLPK